MFSRVKQIIAYSIQYACIMHCTFEYVGDFVVCNGPSMEPTLHSKNILLTERISPRFHNPHRGNIIIAKSPVNPEQYICKRVVAVPGDKVILQATPNSEENEYSHEVTFKGEYVPRGHIWIEGDNSQNSADSRIYGPIPMGLVKSRVVCRLWPLSKMEWLL